MNIFLDKIIKLSSTINRRFEFNTENNNNLKNSSNKIRKSNIDKYPILICIDSNILSIKRNKLLADGENTIKQTIDLIISLLINYNPYEQLNIIIKSSNDEFLINCNDILNEPLYKIYMEYYDKNINMLYIVISRVTYFKLFKQSFFNYFTKDITHRGLV